MLGLVMARKQEDEGEERKFTELVSVRFTPEQLRAVERLARRVGLKVGTFVRVKALETIPWEQEPRIGSENDPAAHPRPK